MYTTLQRYRARAQKSGRGRSLKPTLDTSAPSMNQQRVLYNESQGELEAPDESFAAKRAAMDAAAAMGDMASKAAATKLGQPQPQVGAKNGEEGAAPAPLFRRRIPQKRGPRKENLKVEGFGEIVGDDDGSGVGGSIRVMDARERRMNSSHLHVVGDVETVAEATENGIERRVVGKDVLAMRSVTAAPASSSAVIAEEPVPSVRNPKMAALDELESAADEELARSKALKQAKSKKAVQSKRVVF